ncbi:hypothetical protein [Streptomyces sp. A1277]|uniref:hypothetical protein n=1 Tax=Streptomyces sp. A1277 TaxID=2563103 RepID=UPI001F0E5239|nr:hypothetical protein [Streptomyces sp. A1277]
MEHEAGTSATGSTSWSTGYPLPATRYPLPGHHPRLLQLNALRDTDAAQAAITLHTA